MSDKIDKIAISRNVARTLNRMLSKDAAACDDLANCRISCNSELLDDDTIVVRDDDGELTVGAIGLINGILSDMGCPKIQREVDNKKTTGFGVQYADPIL